MSELLEFKNVTKTFFRQEWFTKKPGTTALNNLSLKVNEGDSTILTVAGESGSGKTTLAMLLLGFISPTSGQILYRGKDINSLKGAERMTFRKEVQAVFQDPFAVFNPFYTVDHLLTVPIKRFKLAHSKKEAREKMVEALSAVGLHPQDILGRFPHQLSGGQRQRINVARALLLRPKILVADEPVSMVDASLRANILETLSTLQKDYGVTILYITHDLTTAYHISKSIIVLYRGTVMEAGDVDTVINAPQHPYTRLLIDSIPWPDLTRRWGETKIKVEEEGFSDKNKGCKFLGRCPLAIEKCQNPPQLYQLNDVQAASCYLFDENAQIESERLSELLPL
ncbi:MAG: ABC transporter ATP-binding protein [Anaerolinea sp. 4484_236]|nr:MAG: ABC transporter ATP-binding protein [Anaerolinea sp. 4484_236]